MYIFSAVKIALLLFNNYNLVSQGFFKTFFHFFIKKIKVYCILNDFFTHVDESNYSRNLQIQSNFALYIRFS